MQQLDPIRIISQLPGFEDPSQSYDRKRQVARAMFRQPGKTSLEAIAGYFGKKKFRVRVIWEELRDGIRTISGHQSRFPVDAEQVEEILDGIESRKLEEELMGKYLQVSEDYKREAILPLHFSHDLYTHIHHIAGYRLFGDMDGKRLWEVLTQADLPRSAYAKAEPEYDRMKQELIRFIDDGEHCSLCQHSS